MPEPAFDMDPSPAPPPGALSIGKDTTPDQPSKSLDDLIGDKLSKVSGEESSLLKQKIGAEGAMAAAQERRDAQYRQRMDHMISAESATANELKPWNAQEELNKRQTTLWEQFGSPGFIIAMLGSSFTAMPMTSALNAGAAAMNAINAGKMDDYHKAFDAWKENSNLTIKRLDLEEKQFGQIDTLRSRDMEAWRASAASLLSRFNDKRKLILLEGGFNDELMQSLDTQFKMRADLSDMTKRIEDNEIRRQVFDALRGGKKDPQAIAQAAADADLAMSGGLKSPEGLAVTNLILQPHFREQPVVEQNKQIQEAVRGISSARYGGRVSPIMTEIQRQFDASDAQADPNETDAEKDARHNKIITGISAAQKPSTGGAPTREKEIKERADALQVEHPDWPKEKAQDEAAKQITTARSTKGDLSANKRADLTITRDKYKNALATIDQVLDVLKSPAAAGLAGRSMRVEERISNILGSRNTKRVQMMRDLQLLKMEAPRLLLGATGRPLKAEEGKIDDIVPGLSIGDLGANTITGLQRLRDNFTAQEGTIDKILSTGVAPVEEAPVETKPDKGWDAFPTIK